MHVAGVERARLDLGDHRKGSCGVERQRVEMAALTGAQLTFYSTAAQVIPVLLLAMSLQLRTSLILR
jgi:hypothetical protein